MSATNTGDLSAATVEGQHSVAVATGYQGRAALSDPGSVAAFHGALFAGADAAMAFEAARRHELLMIPDEPYVTQTQRRYQDGNAYDAAVRRLHEWRERIRGLPNPFREPDAAAQQWGIAA